MEKLVISEDQKNLNEDDSATPRPKGSEGDCASLHVENDTAESVPNVEDDNTEWQVNVDGTTEDSSGLMIAAEDLQTFHITVGNCEQMMAKNRC